MFPRYSVRKLLVLLQKLRDSVIFLDRNVVLDEPPSCYVHRNSWWRKWREPRDRGMTTQDRKWFEQVEAQVQASEA